MKNFRKLALILLLLTLLSLLELPSAKAQELKLDVKEHILKNGLKLLMLEKHRTPVISLRVVYKVGSVNERPGITGVSHLFEHMMFKGTKLFGTKDWEVEEPLLGREDELVEAINKEKALAEGANPERLKALETELEEVRKKLKDATVKDEFWSIYLRNGATGLNASTGEDSTFYYCNLPANKLDLWAFIESDRMQNMVLREFYQERDVVTEERRLRTETSPFGLLFEQLKATAYSAHPYGWPVIGWMSDIQGLTKEETREYFTRYYAPNNAVIVAVGDFDSDYMIKLVEKYFSEIPAQPPLPIVETVEPEQRGERRVYVEYEANPNLAIAYHKPEITHTDQYALEVVESLLSGGRTARLYKSLIEEKRIAVMARVYSGGSRYPDLFLIFVTPRYPHTAEEVEAAIYEELERLKKEPPTEWELQKIKNQLEADFIRSLESTAGLADEIGDYEAIASWRYINTALDKIKAVTAEDIMRVAKKYFTRTNRTVAILVKKEGAE
ncbi:MAG: pitrilysin family protein [Candidatus Brocadiales bacterium]|nr:pitrilysin family protein [Candidatus Brocadiales bacterium]